MGKVFFYAFLAALNPTLLTATTVMLFAPQPKRLLGGYLLGAYTTSITLGLVIVFALDGSSSLTNSSQNTINPIIDFVFAGIALLVAYVLASGRDKARRERRRAREAEQEKGPPFWQRMLARGSGRIAFCVGVLLTLPGASYLASLTQIAKQDLSTGAAVASVVAVNVIMLILLELPTLGYAIAPERTAETVHRFTGWLQRSGRTLAIRGALLVGAAFIVRGLITLLA